MENKVIKNIIFYEENREGLNGGVKYNKYKIPTSEISEETSMGFGGETIIIYLSNGKIIITNDLWMVGSENDIPTDPLIGTIYDSRNGRLFGNTVECYIYSKKNKKRITNGKFDSTYGIHLHEEGTHY